MWFNTIPIISDIPIFNEIMGEDYIKFGDKTGYTHAITNLIIDIFESEKFRKEQQNKIEKVVNKETDGYKIAAVNLLNFIKNIED